MSYLITVRAHYVVQLYCNTDHIIWSNNYGAKLWIREWMLSIWSWLIVIINITNVLGSGGFLGKLHVIRALTNRQTNTNTHTYSHTYISCWQEKKKSQILYHLWRTVDKHWYMYCDFTYVTHRLFLFLFYQIG